MKLADPDLEQKSERLALRIRPSTKQLADRAARELDTSMSRFTAAAIRHLADDVLDADGAVEIVVDERDKGDFQNGGAA